MVEEGLLSPELSPTSKTSAGREASKFRSAIFSLVNFVARRGSTGDLSTVAESLVGNLRAFLQDQGWPTPDRDQDMELRGYGYETIGLLAKAAPEKILLEPTLNLLGWLFRSLRGDASGKDVAVSIEEALSSVLGAFSKPFDDSIRPKFRQVLLKYSMTNQSSVAGGFSRSTRYVATRFANRCLPFNDVLARWIDILAISGGSSERHEVVEEGRKGLDPYWFKMSNTIPGSDDQRDDFSFPDFDELVCFIFALQNDDDNDMEIDDTGNAVQRARCLQSKFPDTLSAVITFCSEVAMHAALIQQGIQEEPSEDWGRKLQTLMSTDLRARQAFRSFATSSTHSTSLATLLRASFDQITKDELADVGEIGSDFVRLLSLCPDKIWTQAELIGELGALQPSILSNNVNRRLATAQAYGLLASHTECDQTLVERLHLLFFEKLKSWRNAVGGEINQTSGAIAALGYYFSRLHWRHAITLSDKHPVYQLLQTIVEILEDSKDATMKGAVFTCLDQLCLFHVINPLTIIRYTKFQDIVQQVYDSAKVGTTSAILTLGHLSMIVDEETDSVENTDYSFVADKLYELHEVRQPEVQFSVGEALSCFASGWNSKALTAELDIEHPDQKYHPWNAPLITPSGPKREKTLAIVLEKTLKGCRQSKPSLKKASVIWLLCLLQYCGHKPEIQQFLPQSQVAFKHCLSDRDEVVQEAASRGLGLVYERGDRQLKDDLVRDLVGSFSDNKAKMSGTVSEDTQLFEPGALPTGDGSITTYKDILNLASEVGDSSLVYRFMSLASNNSIWSSRAAFGRFGLSNIFSDSSIDGYLAENPKLYPKLYRYRYVISLFR
jgi:proteasome component ECM29